MRHGEVFNPGKVLYGRLPHFHLSDLGRQMADGVADYFRGLAEQGHPDADNLRRIYASPLDRAQETAAPIAQALGLPVVTENRIIEADNKFEGMSRVANRLKNPRFWRYLVNPFRPSWGEPYKRQAKRMARAIQDARAELDRDFGPGAQAVMVSHQLPIWVARLSAEKRPLAHDPRKRECTLTSVTSFDFLDGVLSGVRYHEPNAHLLAQAANLPGA